jgi:PKD domain
VASGWQLSVCAATVAMATAVAGCHQRVYVAPAGDAAVDGGGDDGGLIPLTLDIAVTGCASLVLNVTSVTTVVCSGVAPLAVTFSPVGSPVLTSFLWSFGDGSPTSSDRAPMHTYTLPGSYDVKVTGNGTMNNMTSQLSQTRRSLIVVQSVATGGACDVEGQCSGGLHCLCQPGTGCGAAFLRGFCSTSCQTGFCGAGAVCASYAPGTTPDAGTIDADASGSVSAPLCLASCQTDADCPTGFVCQSLPTGGSTTGGWARGCLPLGAAGALGAPCRNAHGVLDDSRCSTGLCADLGQLGVCSGVCDASHPCPSGAACAALSGDRQLCLSACSTTTPCSGEPGLSCRRAGPADGGPDAGAPFSIIGGDPGATYCAPS